MSFPSHLPSALLGLHRWLWTCSCHSNSWGCGEPSQRKGLLSTAQHCLSLPSPSCFEVGLEGRRNGELCDPAALGSGNRWMGVVWEAGYSGGLQQSPTSAEGTCLCVTQESLFHLAFSKGQVKHQLLATSKRQSAELIQGNLCNVC